ncbi:Tryptophan--tRNA ligase [compost metagenome]
MKKVLSGIQPSGKLTLGNYIGALKNFVKLQHEHLCNFMVVDLHAITVPQDPAALREQSEEVAALFVAAGIDPSKANVYMQSHVRQHAQMGWILTTLTNMGELERMTQFKDKSEGKESIGAGLFVYPSLMAYIPEVGARIMSLDDASKKMSKSNPNPGSYISLLDAPADIRKKISRATTDSGSEVRFDPVNKPEISNLITIYSQCAEISVAEVERLYEGKMYGAFKKELAEVVVGVIEPLQQRYHEIRESGEIFDILAQGAERASEMAEQTLTDVQRMMGFITK